MTYPNTPEDLVNRAAMDLARAFDGKAMPRVVIPAAEWDAFAFRMQNAAAWLVKRDRVPEPAILIRAAGIEFVKGE